MQSSGADDESNRCHVLSDPHAFREWVPQDEEDKDEFTNVDSQHRNINLKLGFSLKTYPIFFFFCRGTRIVISELNLRGNRVVMIFFSRESRVFGWWENLGFDQFVWLYMFLKASIFRERGKWVEGWLWNLGMDFPFSKLWINFYFYFFFIHLKFSQETNKDYLYNQFVILLI